MPEAVRVIAVASGKGGVGKTKVSINLAAALAQTGQQVMLMDADLGLANVDVLLGLEPAFDLQHVISGEKSLDEIIVKGPLGISCHSGKFWCRAYGRANLGRACKFNLSI